MSISMKSTPARLYPGLAALALICLPSIASAAPATLLLVDPQPAQTPVSRLDVAADPSGGVLVAPITGAWPPSALISMDDTLTPRTTAFDLRVTGPFALHAESGLIELSDSAGTSAHSGRAASQECIAGRGRSGTAFRRITFSDPAQRLTGPELVDAEGGYYVGMQSTARRHARDCSARSLVGVEGSKLLLAPDRERAGAYVLTGASDGQGGTRFAAIVASTPDALRWRTLLPRPLLASPQPRLIAAADGGVWIFGHESGSDDLVLARYSGEGARLWQRRLPFGAQIEITHAGELTLVATTQSDGAPTGPTTLRLFGGDGATIAERALGVTRGALRVATVREDEALLGVVVGPGHLTNQRLFRIGNGDALQELPPLTGGRRAAMITFDGTLIATEVGPSGEPFPYLHRRDPVISDVGVLSLDFSSRGTAPTASVPHQLDGEGSFYVVPRDGGESELVHLSPDGSLRWRRFLPPADARRLVTGAGRVCVESRNLAPTPEPAPAIRCLLRSDGSQIYDTRWPAFASPLLVLDAQGALHGFAFESTGPDADGSLRRVTLGPSGIVQQTGSVSVAGARGGPRDLVTAPNGRFAIAWSLGAAPVISVHEADGTLIRTRTQPAGFGAPRAIGLSDGGDVLLANRPGAGDELQIAMLASNAASDWTRTLAAPNAAAFPIARTVGAEWLLLPDADADAGRASTFAITSLARADGAIRWRGASASPRDPHAQKFFAVDAERRRLLQATIVNPLAALTPEGVRLDWFSLDDGRRLLSDDQLFDRLATLHALALQPDGNARLLTGHDDVRDFELRSYRVAAPATPSDLLAAQADLLGTWYSPLSSGQGLFLDYDAAGPTLFGAWFTHTTTALQTASEQRWYTLLPSATPGSGALQLTIYRNVGGRFATGPGTSADPVGSAVLRRLDCQNALLEYRFDADTEGGVAGATPLRRAAPATRACNGGPGVVSAPSRGLDPRSSGAWFDPSASGQGLAFDLRPPQGDDAGLFAGAWFTYDVAGQADDPTAQHWFTLAGGLSQAASGELRVPILRTIGGSLDAEPTSNTSVVGEATLRFTACDRATLEYRFADIDIAQSFAGREGSIPLLRIGGCGD
jgi:hypothetical protein